MAFTKAALRLLSRTCVREPFAGPILTLGRQAVYATLDEVREIVAAAGLPVRELPADLPARANVPGFDRLPYSTYTSDHAVFMAMCGASVQALDVSDYEGADYVHDLNVAIAPELRGRFGTIIDGGTLEHVFDIARALENLVTMLKPGGRIVHMNPVSNWAEHGFYQFSPTFYSDFYVANGFEVLDCLLIETPIRNLDNGHGAASSVWRWDPGRPPVPLVTNNLLTIYFEARRGAARAISVPQQGSAGRSGSTSRLAAMAARTEPTFLGKAREALVRVSPLAMGLVAPVKRLLGRDLTRRPWGLERVGRV